MSQISKTEVQGFPKSTPHRAPLHPQVSQRLPFQATPWLPVKRDKSQQYEISMPVNLNIETVSQPERPKSAQLAAHTKTVPPSAVSRHQSNTCPSFSIQHQPSVHFQVQDNTPCEFPTTMHMSSVSPHPSNVPTSSSLINMHDNGTTMHVSSNVTSGMPTDMTPSPDGPHPPPASTMPPDPSMYASHYGLHFPTTTTVSPQAYLTQVPPTFHYGVQNAIYSTPLDSYLPPAPPVFPGTSFSNETDPGQLHQASGDQQHTLHSNSAIPPTFSTPVHAPRTVHYRLAPMKPRLLSFRELQAELRDLARESKKSQTHPKAKKTYAQAQFTTASLTRVEKTREQRKQTDRTQN